MVVSPGERTSTTNAIQDGGGDVTREHMSIVVVVAGKAVTPLDGWALTPGWGCRSMGEVKGREGVAAKVDDRVEGDKKKE